MLAASTPGTAVGFVGLGTMGGPIASRLLAGGVPLAVYNRDRAKAEPLVAAGAVAAESPRALGRLARGQTVFVLVSDARAVREVLFGRNGVVAGGGPGTRVVNLSTIAPEESRALAERLARRSVRYLEAPLGGSRDAAERGELLVYAGGDPADLASARPLLERFARRIEHLGPVGCGTAMKLVNNLVGIGTVALDAEAIALAEALGLDPVRALDLLMDGAGESRMLASKRDAFARREYPVRFRLALAAKDLGLVSRAAREVGAGSRIGREARRLADEGVRAGLGEQDFAALLEAARRRRTGASGSVPPPPPGPA